MLVVFGQFLKRFRPIRIPGSRKAGPRRERIEIKLAFEQSDVPERPEEKVVRERGGDSAAEKREGLFEFSGFTKPTGDARHLGPVFQRRGGGVLECIRDDSGKAGEGQDIGRVVLEDREQTRGMPRPQIFEVNIGNERTGEIAVPLDAEDLILEIDQAAAIEAKLPETAGAEKQIQMLHPREGRARAIHPVTCFEQRLIEGPSVVSDQNAKRSKMLR